MTEHLKLDHIVYAVPDLEGAIDEFTRRLGSAPAFGGRHEGLGTHNAILPLAGETYVELIAADPGLPAPNQQRPFGLDSLQGPRLVTWAVRSRNIEADATRARERGYDPGIVFEMSRKEPDGEVLRWKLSLRAKPLGDGLVPFVIDWGSATHPAAASAADSVRCTLGNLSAQHPDPQAVRGALDALGVELSVDEAPTANLCARLTGPAGSLELE
ncbi:MAG: VOC family protein [Deltaproteobacteria bacterium]|nr:VOC family protein [Deltaproteobacteria bacterium]MBW2390339.1 VOC family protein [Deltaproteobacteria bacterium]MBW2725001.1 VOC family protein [Deltaproteobacteria bacterium]